MRLDTLIYPGRHGRAYWRRQFHRRAMQGHNALQRNISREFENRALIQKFVHCWNDLFADLSEAMK